MRTIIKTLSGVFTLVLVAISSFSTVMAQESFSSTIPPQTKDAPDGFISLFDGKTLEGWDGDEKFWSVENGCITGRSTKETPVPYSTFLVWQGEPVGNFTLLVDFSITSGNSGIEYRAWKDDQREYGLNGYQADISPGDIMGIFYGEGLGEIIARRGEAVIFNKDGEKTTTKFADAQMIGNSINMTGWNTYRIEAHGNRFTTYINDVKTAELVDERD